ncbi:hypothetical protein BKA56DRAFT_672355 [Ilyonectria sp. MPI-CAGE-AT-0026]|nr:hypothetical protein BKA56DRAFT_672355 [Ilyonectria sp. MPI-CAGE-AT-0026]
MSPLLLSTLLSGNYTQVEEKISTGEKLPAVYNAVLDLTVIFNPNTSLPYIIRSYENHKLFGRSTHDLLVHDYTQIEGVMFPKRLKTIYNGDLLLADYVMVVELDDSVIVFDAPAHQSILVMQWVQETLGKSVTHVWSSHHHHHHHHALRTADYVARGAKVITVDQARDYYSNIPERQFLTYSTSAPMVLKGTNMQVTFTHMNGSVHAFDHSYAHILPSCAAVNSTSLIFDADHVTPLALDVGDHGGILELVDRMADDRVASDTM